MNMMSRKAAAASLLLAAGLGLPGFMPAIAQGDEAAAEDVVEAEAEDVAECVDDVDCVAVEDAPADADESAAQEPPAEVAAQEAPAEGAAVVVPGSTDESQPGGSTRPGTTPDD